MIGAEVGGAGGAPLSPRQRDPETPFALGQVPRTWRQLQEDAAGMGASLPLPAPGQEVMVACADRYLQAVLLVATWQAGCVAALPPNGRQDTIDGLCAARGISLILHDGRGEGGIDVRARLGAAARALAPLVYPADRTLVCVYTSGSTGAHVGYGKTALQLLGEADVLARLFDVGPGARVIATVPPHHIYGLLFGVLVPFMGGAAFARSTPLHAETVAAEARACGANVLVSTPVHLRGIAELPPGALPTLGRIFSSGAALDPGVGARVAASSGRAVTEILGSTETGGIAWRECDGSATDATPGVVASTTSPGVVATTTTPGVVAWQPLPGVRVEVEDNGTGDAAMVVSSPFVEGARLRTADRIRLLPNGRFEWLGRADGVVKIGGTRVAVAETERLLREIPGVRDAAVLSVDVGGARGWDLWAAVEADGLSVADLRAALQRRLEPVAVPRRFRIVAALPREDNGKLVRNRLAALFAPAVADSRSTVVTVPLDWKFFRGHFDGFPVVAGVVQLNEIVLPEVRASWPALGPLRRIAHLKFRRPIAPGSTLALELAERGANKIAFALRRGAEVVSSGALEFGAAAGDLSK